MTLCQQRPLQAVHSIAIVLVGEPTRQAGGAHVRLVTSTSPELTSKLSVWVLGRVQQRFF